MSSDTGPGTCRPRCRPRRTCGTGRVRYCAMDDLPYVRSERTVEDPLDASLLVVAPQERQNLEDLIARDGKASVGEMEIIPVQQDSSLPEGQRTFEFRLHHTV